MMTAAYNPFELLSLPLVRRLVQQGNRYIVLQRFSWPGVRRRCGFIGTPYITERNARQHQAQLSEKEGKTLSLTTDMGTMTSLLEDLRYHVFLSTFRDEKWERKLLKLYGDNVLTFLKTNLKINELDGVDIHLHLSNGKLKASVTLGEAEYEYDVCVMVNS